MPFLIIAITPPDFFKGEGERINQLLSDESVDFVHIRKPDSSEYETEKLIKEIDPRYHHKIKLHDHFQLLDKYNLGGIHLNSRNKEIFRGARSVSISLHSLDELEGKEIYDYFFISPIYDSISKEGYSAKFNLAELSQKIQGKNAIALGGVTPDKFQQLKSLGFKGAALLGYFFPIKKIKIP